MLRGVTVDGGQGNRWGPPVMLFVDGPVEGWISVKGPVDVVGGALSHQSKENQL